MTGTLLYRQLSLTSWATIRSGRGSAEGVADLLRVALLQDDDSADEALEDLENIVVAQGNVFECAPPVVAAILAALAGDVIPVANLAPCLDLLGRIVAGRPDPTEVALGAEDLTNRVLDEAMRGYWLLVRTATGNDPLGAWRTASAVLTALDAAHSRALLGVD